MHLADFSVLNRCVTGRLLRGTFWCFTFVKNKSCAPSGGDLDKRQKTSHTFFTKNASFFEIKSAETL